MTDCSKCLRTDIKCCFTCKKDADKCKVWHHCGSNCPEHESRIKTNADRIRLMSDEELAELFNGFSTICNMCIFSVGCHNVENERCKNGILKWLQTEEVK